MHTRRSLPLLWNTRAPATLYLFLPEAGRPKVAVHSGSRCRIVLQSPDGTAYHSDAAASPITASDAAGPPGVWTVTVISAPPEAAPRVHGDERPGDEGAPEGRSEVPLWVESDTGYPFAVWGPGIVPSHIPAPEPVLKLHAPHRNVDVHLWVPSSLKALSLQSNFPGRPLTHLLTPDNRPVPLEWKPVGGSYGAVEIPVSVPGWWKLPVPKGSAGQLATWEGVPAFAEQGPGLPECRLEVRVRDARNEPVAARVELWRGRQRWAIQDILAGEAAEFHTLPGQAQIRISRGFSAVPRVAVVQLHEGSQSVDVALEDLLVPPPGWICGDHHVHSYCEDGGQSPEAVVRAAAAQGLDYVFVTDEPEPLLERDFQQYNRPGKFLAMPGQECFNAEVHCNALNTYEKLPSAPCGEDQEDRPGPALWLERIDRQSKDHPALLMLNHPSHLPGVMDKRSYFHAWGQADEHPGILLVENFDFESWFARLNAGRRLTALWTTDSHDVAWLPAGRKRSYVYVGKTGEAEPWTEADVIAGLAKGAVINTRHPGALLFITVNGAIPGEEAERRDDLVTVRIECRSTRPLRKVELIACGKVYAEWPGHSSLSFELSASFALPAPGWALARAYAYEEPQPRDGHSNEPLAASQCIAFTNPVYLR